MGENEGTGALFDDTPAVKEGREAAAEAPRGAPRLQHAVRDQIELRACDLDALLAPEHRARAIYQERGTSVECANAQLRHRDLWRFNVCGLAKARAVLLWHALAHNLQRTIAFDRVRQT